MAWIYLALAAAFEIAFALGMKASQGFTNPLATALTVVAVIGGITFLTLALKTLPISVAYPIWTAAGTFGAAIVGVLVFGEAINWLKALGLAAIVAGVATLRAAA